MLSLYLFGPPRLEVDGQPVTLETHKALALLAYLALEGRAQPRSALARLLWPELPPERGLANLRRTLSGMQRALPPGALTAGRETLAPGAGLWCDALRFRELAAAGQAEEARALAQGAPFKGWSLPGCPAFEQWRRGWQARLAQESAGLPAGLPAAPRAGGAVPPSPRGAPGEVLLLSKLYRPAVRERAVRRERLTARLDALVREGSGSRLGLVSAPPGFGKTSLLAEWAANCGAPVAWLGLDAGDNDPTRFCAYLIAAVQGQAGPGAGETASALLKTLPPLPVETALAALINDLLARQQPLAVVLDDYQWIESAEAHRATAFLVEHLRPPIALVIATRADPPLPLARLRARGELVEIRADDLRFTEEETAAFLQETAGLAGAADAAHDREIIEALAERTEGWAAGLQMAALASRGRADPGAFLRAFSGGHHFVLDYLTEEVLGRLPAETTWFLLHTSPLERFCADLLEAVLGPPWTAGRCQGMLEALERANLFTVPLDAERRWFRYHHLFADLLRVRLKQQWPGEAGGTHARAAAWYERSGQPAAAVRHWLAAAAVEAGAGQVRAYAEAARLVETCAMPLFLRGESTTFLDWLDALPAEQVDARPLLGLYRAAVYGLRGEIEDSQRLVEQVQARLGPRQARGELAPELQAALNNLTGIHLAILDLRDRPEEVIAEARRALAAGSLDPINQVTALLSLGHAHFIRGELEQALRTWKEAEARVDASANPYGLALSLSHQARACKVLGRLRDAQALYERGLAALAGREEAAHMGLGILEAGLGDLLRERGDLPGARRLIEAGLRHPPHFGGLNGLVQAQTALARLALAEGDPSAALASLERNAAYLPHPALYPEHREAAEVALALAWLAAGKLDRAARWAGEVESGDGFRGEWARITAARVRLATGDAAGAAEALARLAGNAEAAGRLARAIEARALRAAALARTRQASEALDELGRALAAAEETGFASTLLDAGEALPGLLALGIRRGAWPSPLIDYAKRLLRPGAPLPARPGELVEALSAREVEVLRLIAEGLSNGEIAARLVISTGTVRAHTARIYRKLDVTSRTQAAAKGRGLGIIEA